MAEDALPRTTENQPNQADEDAVVGGEVVSGLSSSGDPSYVPEGGSQVTKPDTVVETQAPKAVESGVTAKRVIHTGQTKLDIADASFWQRVLNDASGLSGAI